ncbi:MAG: putative nucleotidyltransferase substrate binding domain-containing protein [Thermodesulfobacteriota bacterium]
MIKEESIEFFSKVLPFSMMAKQDLALLVESTSMDFFPRGEKILKQGGSPSKHLYIIKKGGVKVYVESEQGAETIIDYRSEGEQFGILSLVGGDRSRANVVAFEDTIAYLIPRDVILAVLQKNPSVNEYFLKSFVINFIDKSHDEARQRVVGIGSGEQLLFTTTVGDLLRRDPVTVAPDVPTREVAAEMVRQGVSSVVVVDGNERPTGMVTDRDFREKVVAGGTDPGEPIKNVMSSCLYSVDSGEYCFEALLKMMRYRVHHLPVIDKGSLRGMITNHDFMVLQGMSPTVLVKDIENARVTEDLKKTAPSLWKAVAGLLREGARAHNVTGFISELAEKMINRLLDILEEEIGKPPLPYTLFLYGAGARRELVLDLDIRLGAVIEDTDDPELAELADKYFRVLRSELEENLRECCAKASPEKIFMANCLKSMGKWQAGLKNWRAEIRDGLPLAELFEMRAIRGDSVRTEILRNSIVNGDGPSREMMNYLGKAIMEHRPPLGFFKKFVVEKTGEQRNKFDLYNNGIRPLVGAVRFFSVETGGESVLTPRRLKELGSSGYIEQSEDIAQVMDYMFTLLVHKQLQQIDEGGVPDSFINPDILTDLEKKTLKEAFLLTGAQFDIIERYNWHENR